MSKVDRDQRRGSREWAARIFDSLVPLQARLAVSRRLAKSIQEANEAGSDRWGVRLNPVEGSGSIMLKVGRVEVLQIVPGYLHLLTKRSSVPQHVRQLPGWRWSGQKDTYRNAPDSEYCDIDYSALDHLPDIANAHAQIVHIAAKSPRHTSTAKDHSPGVLDFLDAELGIHLPRPSFASVQSESADASRTISIPVTRIVGDRIFEGIETFDAPRIPPIATLDTNEETFRAAIEAVPTDYRTVVNDLYRELVLGNFATFDGRSGADVESELDRSYADRGSLPGFVRKSGRYNAAGMALYNAVSFAGTREDYVRLASILSALVEGGWDNPRVVLSPRPGDGAAIPEEVVDEALFEGAVRTIQVNSYERNHRARQACLDHFGYDCACCGFNFERAYGAAGRGFIHVHHIVPIGSIRASYRVNPLRDLIPVCANCHAIIHSPSPQPPYTVEEVRLLISAAL